MIAKMMYWTIQEMEFMHLAPTSMMMRRMLKKVSSRWLLASEKMNTRISITMRIVK